MGIVAGIIALVLSATYLPMAVEDFRSREVSELSIFLPYLNFIYAFYVAGELSIAIFVLAAGFAVIGEAIYKKGQIGSGDVYALPLVVSSFYAYPWTIIYLPITFGVHMAYYVIRNGFKLKRKRTGKLDDSSKYIPIEADGKKVEGVVDERYSKTDDSKEVLEEFGVPLAGYIALAGFLGCITYAIVQLI